MRRLRGSPDYTDSPGDVWLVWVGSVSAFWSLTCGDEMPLGGCRGVLGTGEFGCRGVPSFLPPGSTT